VIANRLAVAAVAVLGVVVLADALRSRTEDPAPSSPSRLVIDLESSRERTSHPEALLAAAFPGRQPDSLAVSKVAVARDDLVAIGVSHVPGNRRAAAAVELWEGDELVRAFRVPPGSFSRGLWFAGDGEAIATIGWNGRSYLYDRDGVAIGKTAYVAYETR
jgi:hypothetical protein